MVFAMTVICLMLFVTICVLAGGLGLNYNFQKMLGEMTPADVNYAVYYGDGENERPDADKVLSDLYEEKKGELFASDAVQMTIYESEELTVAETIGKDRFTVAGMVEFSAEEMPEDIVKVSDYNRLAGMYGLSKLEVPEGTYAIEIGRAHV